MFDIHSTSAAAYFVTVDGDEFRFGDANAACVALAQLTTQFHSGLTPRDIFPAIAAEAVVARYRECVETRQGITYVSEIASAAGPRMWRTTLLPILGGTGHVTSIIGVCCETPEATDTPTLSLNDKASLALGAIDGGFWVYDVGEKRFETSRPLAELLAGPGHTTLGLAEYLNHLHSEDLAKAGLSDTDLDRSMSEYRVVTFDGRTLWLRSRRRIIRDGSGAPVRVVGLVGDITTERQALQALETEASTDALTLVGNRRFFDRQASRSFQEARAAGAPIGVLLIDLDGFKPINDRLGHRAGDELLRKTAKRIARYVRKSDVVARIGGDEFAILLRGSSTSMIEPLATRLHHAFTKPFDLGERSVLVGISTGAAVSTAQDETIDTLIERADAALYHMKQQGRLRSA